MDNKYSLYVLNKALEELNKEIQGLEMLREELGEYYVNKNKKELEAKILDLEFHIDFIS